MWRWCRVRPGPEGITGGFGPPRTRRPTRVEPSEPQPVGGAPHGLWPGGCNPLAHVLPSVKPAFPRRASNVAMKKKTAKKSTKATAKKAAPKAAAKKPAKKKAAAKKPAKKATKKK